MSLCEQLNAANIALYPIHGSLSNVLFQDLYPQNLQFVQTMICGLCDDDGDIRSVSADALVPLIKRLGRDSMPMEDVRYYYCCAENCAFDMGIFLVPLYWLHLMPPWLIVIIKVTPVLDMRDLPCFLCVRSIPETMLSVSLARFHKTVVSLSHFNVHNSTIWMVCQSLVSKSRPLTCHQLACDCCASGTWESG